MIKEENSSEYKPYRLFVPVTSKVFNWYRYGGKRWEIRKSRKSFNAEHVRKHHKVEIRRGYSTEDSLFGNITAVVEAVSLNELFDKIPEYETSLEFYKKLIPEAESEIQAKTICGIYIGKFKYEAVNLFAFRVENLIKMRESC